MLKVEKEKLRVAVLIREHGLIKGFIHMNPGERTMDFLNDTRRNFIALTDVEIQSTAKMRSFKLYAERSKRRKTIIVNKADIKWVEEL